MATSNLLKNKGSLQFEDKWDLMRPIVLKLLRQEAVTKQQWFDLFSDVHAVCLWDDKGPAKIHQALKEDILDFIKQAQAVGNVLGWLCFTEGGCFDQSLRNKTL